MFQIGSLHFTLVFFIGLNITIHSFLRFLHLKKLKANEILAFLSVSIFGISLIPIIYGYLARGTILLILFTLFFALTIKSMKIKKNEVIFIFLTLIAYQGAIVSLFPSKSFKMVAE